MDQQTLLIQVTAAAQQYAALAKRADDAPAVPDPHPVEQARDAARDAAAQALTDALNLWYQAQCRSARRAF